MSNDRPTEKERLTITVKEAAELIGVSLPTMYEIIKRVDFDALLEVGRKNRKKLIYYPKWLDWLERQTQSGNAL